MPIADGGVLWDNYGRFDVVAHIVFSEAAPYREAAFAFPDYQEMTTLQA